MYSIRTFKGTVSIHPVCDTARVKYYSEYEMAGIPDARKLARRDAESPAMPKLAYEVGKRNEMYPLRIMR